MATVGVKGLTAWLRSTHSKVGISHVVFSRSRLTLSTAEVTEATEATTEIAASDRSTEQKQSLHTSQSTLVSFMQPRQEKQTFCVPKSSAHHFTAISASTSALLYDLGYL